MVPQRRRVEPGPQESHDGRLRHPDHQGGRRKSEEKDLQGVAELCLDHHGVHSQLDRKQTPILAKVSRTLPCSGSCPQESQRNEAVEEPLKRRMPKGCG